jgi:diadenosine tetraphosphate (Ap4A) HIT family hydrolase
MGEDIFCKLFPIWKKNNQIFIENNSSFGILSVEPYFAGQGLIIPKTHLEKISELEDVSYLHLVERFNEKILQLYDSNSSDLIEFYEKLFDNPLTPKSKELARLILDSEKLEECPMGYNIGMNLGLIAGQTVNHLHIHYIPRRKSDISQLGVGSAFNSLLLK